MPIKDAFELYRKKFPNLKIAFTAFYKLKPKNIKQVLETNRRCCLCQICYNIALKVEAAKNFVTAKIQNTHSLSKPKAGNITVCKYDDEFPEADCLNRRCDKCGPAEIHDSYKELINAHGEKVKEYYKWETITIAGKDYKLKKCVSYVPKSSKFIQFLDEFEKDLDPLQATYSELNGKDNS